MRSGQDWGDPWEGRDNTVLHLHGNRGSSRGKSGRDFLVFEGAAADLEFVATVSFVKVYGDTSIADGLVPGKNSLDLRVFSV